MDYLRPPTEDPDDLVIEASKEALEREHVADVLGSYESRSVAADDLRDYLMDDGPMSVYNVYRRRIVDQSKSSEE